MLREFETNDLTETAVSTEFLNARVQTKNTGTRTGKKKTNKTKENEIK